MNHLDKRLLQLAAKGENAVRRIADSNQPGLDRGLTRLLIHYMNVMDAENKGNPNHDPDNGQFTSGGGGGGGKSTESEKAGGKKTNGWQIRHSKRYYEEVRNRAPFVDARKIAASTGFTAEQAEAIRQHVFLEEHMIDGKMQRFAPDYYQSVAWQRLCEGKGTDEDILFLNHELKELTYMRDLGYNQEEAHMAANREYDWWAAVKKRLEGG